MRKKFNFGVTWRKRGDLTLDLRVWKILSAFATRVSWKFAGTSFRIVRYLGFQDSFI